MDIRGFFGKASKPKENDGKRKLANDTTKIETVVVEKKSVGSGSKSVSIKPDTGHVDKKMKVVKNPSHQPNISKDVSHTKKKAKIDEDSERYPLQGKTFVITGEFNNFGSRDDMQMEIQKLGGKVTSAVSSRTSHLVYGHVLQDGRAPELGGKYIKAKDLGVEMIDEEKFIKMIGEANVLRANAMSAIQSCSTKLPSTKNATSHDTTHGNTQLWADKYKPKTIEDLIGNATAIKALSDWVRNWENVHLHGAPKPAFTKQNPGAKAALISGPPGIGKSSAAGIIARHFGFDVFELNASDARSKNVVAARLGDAINSTSLSRSSKKRLVIMDEVDGMSSDDRGGIQELIKIIKSSKVPIICICNDRMKSNVRSLANHCFDLKFMKPHVQSIVKRVLEVAQKEGMDVEPNAITVLVQETQQDVRQVLGTLQMWQRSSNSMNFEQIQQRKKQLHKDEFFFMNFFDATKFIFKERNNPATFALRNEFYFVDYDLIPLLIQEKYPDAARSHRDEMVALRALSDAADAICDADLAQNYVRSQMEWGLLPMVAALNVRAAAIADGQLGVPGFPEWLGKNSTRNKKSRLLSETAMHMRQTATLNPRTLRLDYLTTLRNRLLTPLLQKDKEKLNQTVELMSSYGLDRDDLFETMQELQISSKGVNVFDKIDSKIKGAFTREYNQHTSMSQALSYEKGIQGLKSKKKLVKVTEEGDEDNEPAGDEDEIKELLALGSKLGKKVAAKSTARGGKARKKK